MRTKKPVYKKVRCDSCNVLVINNVICHETGCPDAWRDYWRSCKWCGQEFKPEEKNQNTCSEECNEAYNGG